MDKIKKEMHITTIDGEIVIKDFNGHIVYADEYIIGDDDELEYECEGKYTLDEIGHLMKDVDGKNHKVIWGN